MAVGAERLDPADGGADSGAEGEAADDGRNQLHAKERASQKKGLAAVLEKGGSEGGGGGGIAGLATVAKPPAEETAVEEFVATDAPSQSEAAPAAAES